LEQLDTLKEAFVDVDPTSTIGRQIAKIEKEMRKDQETRQKKTKPPKPTVYKFEDKSVANPTSMAYDCKGELNGGSFFAGITYKTNWEDPLVAAWGNGLCGTMDAPAMNNYNIILDFNGVEHDTGLVLTCDYKYSNGGIVHRDNELKELDGNLISQST